MHLVKLAAYALIAFCFLAACSTSPTPELKTYGVSLPACLIFCKANVSTAETATGNATGVISSEPPAVAINAP